MNQKINNHYDVVISKSAAKQIKHLDKKDYLRILEKIKELAAYSISLDIKKLAGLPSLYRLRVGQYRVVYEIHEAQLIIHIIAVGPRGDIYQRLKKLF